MIPYSDMCRYRCGQSDGHRHPISAYAPILLCYVMISIDMPLICHTCMCCIKSTICVIQIPIRNDIVWILPLKCQWLALLFVIRRILLKQAALQVPWTTTSPVVRHLVNLLTHVPQVAYWLLQVLMVRSIPDNYVCDEENVLANSSLPGGLAVTDEV